MFTGGGIFICLGPKTCFRLYLVVVFQGDRKCNKERAGIQVGLSPVCF
jgi:hypothetical protein